MKLFAVGVVAIVTTPGEAVGTPCWKRLICWRRFDDGSSSSVGSGRTSSRSENSLSTEVGDVEAGGGYVRLEGGGEDEESFFRGLGALAHEIENLPEREVHLVNPRPIPSDDW